jgi:putative adenylate-forming enzyme
MNLLERALLVAHFVRTRWGLKFASRAELKAWQAKRMARFLAAQLPRAPFYRVYAGASLAQIPVIDKSVMLANFDRMNAAGITLDEATAHALDGETSRDFNPSLRGVTVGLSSGTQGPRGVFLAAPRERAKWAGIMLARVLPPNMLRALLLGRAPIKVAFFLRANSNLYTTLKSRRIDFRFYDLFQGFDAHLPALEQHQPDILVGPSRILGKLAELALAGSLRLSPRRVIAVAEVLEPDDREKIEQAFGVVVHQLYQCTEGFLAYTCELGTLHLNEEFVHVEKGWLDAGRTHFVPIVTDFSRDTQLIIRYRLNDILRVRNKPCSCGRVSLALDAIEGRSDDVVCLRKPGQIVLAEIYPDMVRHAIAMAPRSLPDYRIEQHGMALHIAVADHQVRSFEEIVAALSALFSRLGVSPPEYRSMVFVEAELHVKRRRIVCMARPIADAMALERAGGAPVHA